MTLSRDQYNNDTLKHAGISSQHRGRLERLHRGGQDVYSVADAAELWSMPEAQARRLLAHLASSGWLVRVRRGHYAVTPLEASEPQHWQIDPWVAAYDALAPCYLGGWTAAEHWHLTEQIFRDLLVVTGRRFRDSRLEIQGTTSNLYHRAEDKHFGTELVWRGQARVPVSDPSKTIVDVLGDPPWAGGIRHAAEMLAAYFEDYAEEALLLEYAERLGNRTVFKRLGYLSELLQVGSPQLRATCSQRLSEGVSNLDPSVPAHGPIVSRWNLRINVLVSRGRSA